MSHKVVQQSYEFQRGAKIVVLDNTGTAVKVTFIEYQLGTLLVQFPGGSRQRIPLSRYQHTYSCSQDCHDFIMKCRGNNLVGVVTPSVVEMITTIWAACEQHYGIGEEGSTPADRRREVAFAILKGDPMALDMATDVLG